MTATVATTQPIQTSPPGTNTIAGSTATTAKSTASNISATGSGVMQWLIALFILGGAVVVF